MTDDFSGFSVFYRDHMETISDKFGGFLYKQCICHILKDLNHFFVGVKIYLFFVFAFCHILGNDTDHPDNAQKMIDVLVGDEDIFNIMPVDLGFFQTGKDFASSTTVYQKMPVVVT